MSVNCLSVKHKSVKVDNVIDLILSV